MGVDLEINTLVMRIPEQRCTWYTFGKKVGKHEKIMGNFGIRELLTEMSNLSSSVRQFPLRNESTDFKHSEEVFTENGNNSCHVVSDYLF